MAQLAERLLPIPKDLGSNPIIGNFYWTFIYCQRIVEKRKVKKKRPGMVYFWKKIVLLAKGHKAKDSSKLLKDTFCPVWPDDETKSSPILSKSCPKISEAILKFNSNIFKEPIMFPDIWATFVCKNICYGELSKNGPIWSHFSLVVLTFSFIKTWKWVFVPNASRELSTQ